MHLPLTNRTPCSEPGHAVWVARPWVALVLLALLSACGGGNDTAASREMPQAAPNITISSDGSGVSMQGSFDRVSAYLSHSARVLVGSSQDASSVTMSLSVPKPGFYEVFNWLPQTGSECGRASATVHHAQGHHSVALDQCTGGGEWLSLGVFQFARDSGRVVFSRVGGNRLVVDAVRLQWVGEQRAALEVPAQTLSVGLKDQSYRSSFTISGGLPPFEYHVSSGTLPAGITLAPAEPVLAGRAATAGRYAFEITVRDAAGATARAEFELIIADSAADEPVDSTTPVLPAAKPRERPLDAASSAPDLSNLLAHIAAMPEGSWSKVNLNSFSDVWTPAALRPLYGTTSNPTPSKIIMAWSSFAWDPKRATLLLYGGGHANYSGNDVYLWRASTQRWERASLPSQVVQDALGIRNAIDGADKAPASAHTYDNNIYFPLVDRMLVLGGAADRNGGHFLTLDTVTTSRKTGPYLFDPSRAHPDRVGGTTGSHVQRVAPYPEIVGGNMWSNRESWLNASSNSTPPSESFVNGCTGYAEEDGRDVAYVRTAYRLYKYRIFDLGNAAADRWELVGRYYNGSGAQATCSYDTQRRVFVSTNRSTSSPFVYLNLNTPGKSNSESYFTPFDPNGEFSQLLSSGAIDIRYCGIEFDARRAQHKLWCGDGRVWTLSPPATLSSTGWTITKDTAVASAVPPGAVGAGVLGKWKYIPNLDVFIGLQDPVLGNVWIYKPPGWTNPAGGNQPPSVALSAPAAGATYTFGAKIDLVASASDMDGSVSVVEFFAGAVKVGQAMAAPYRFEWADAAVGNWVLTAVATDNQGAKRTSIPVSISVQPAAAPNEPPTVLITKPAPAAALEPGVPVEISANAADTDGSVTKVEFFAGATKIGETLSAPFRLMWSPTSSGPVSITAVATDDRGARVTSEAVNVTVLTGTGGANMVMLQRGTWPNATVADLYLSSYHKTTNLGGSSNVQDQREYYSTLLRFAIFQSEGGPVPDGAQIVSAKLALYKYSTYDMVYGLHRVLQDWSENAATWNQRLPNQPWAVPGANGAGSDYTAAADATATTSWDPEWIVFDLTAAVAGMSNDAGRTNYGWRLRSVSGNTNLKRMYSSEFAADPALRPKLVVSYR
jgi:hypothetical protein